MDFLDRTFLGNLARAWVAAAAITLGALLWLRLVKAVGRRFAGRPRPPELDLTGILGAVLRRTSLPLLTLLALYLGLLALELSTGLRTWTRTLAIIAVLFQIAIWLDGLWLLWVEVYQRKNMTADASRVTTVRAGSFVVRLVLFTLVLLLALDNIPGVEVTALITGLGVGGIAVALAVQSILADLFASLSITLDKPFVIGDAINVGEFNGTVEHIGLKTTRLRSLGGEQLVFANSDLLNSRIRNYKRMSERRAVFRFAVVYDTPPDQLERIPALVREAIESLPDTRFDRAHFQKFGDSSLDFEAVYWLTDPDYNLFMDRQQAINLALVRRFAAEGIEFAYPTRTLYVRQGEAGGPGS